MLLEMESPPASARRREHTAAERRGTAAPAFHLERRVDGKLWLLRDGVSVAVEIVRCFPWSEPERFLSLRDSEGTEHAFVSDARELTRDSRAALQSGLARAGFVLDIVRVLAVDEDFELRSFSVETAQGARRFQTALDAWPRRLESGGIVLEDVYGDLYRIAAPHDLDAQSAKLMRPFID